MGDDKNHSPPGLGFLNRSRETMADPQRQRLLAERFLKILRLALDHSPAYQDIYSLAGIDPAEIKSLDDLERLPIVRMKDLTERQGKDPPWGGFVTAKPEEIRRIYVNPGFIFQPDEGGYRDFSWAEALAAAGFGPGDRVLNTFNYHLWPFAFMMDNAIQMVGATVIPTGVGNTFLQVRIMNRLKVTGFVGTPSFLMTLAQRAEALGMDIKTDLFLEKALVGAEALPESLREGLQEKLGMTILQCYGTVFLGCLGYECPQTNGLHVPENVLVEVVDPKTGRAVLPGTPGEIVATNFNPVFPLIRMATGDLSRLLPADCPCGRTGPRLAKIMGRIDQATKVSGTFVHPWQADEVMGNYPEVFKYQVVVTRENHNDLMTFCVELVEEIADQANLKARIERDIKEMLSVKGTVKIVPRGTIPDFHKTIVDNRKWD